MIKKLFILSTMIFLFSNFINAQLSVTEIGKLPVSVSNNAVCEGFINDVPFLFSFSGIDSTKIYSGIHLKSYRYNLESGEVLRLPDLPDNQGKIACAASRIGNIIYISGGYHVNSNGSEVSSRRMHRYDIINNIFLDDGANLPKATDDHVQAVWRDSLIFVVTGWSNNGNISNVQIYNPSSDTWQVGDPIPSNNQYRSFGSTGSIIDDTIYYFGGATSSGNFPIQNQIRKGIIDPEDPTNIEWSIVTPDIDINGYRMASTVVKGELHWVGGSNVTYNFNGIAYNGTGGVPPSNRDLYIDTDLMDWNVNIVSELPMDLRGIASVNDTLKYLAGGMLSGQSVTNKIYKLEWSDGFLSNDDLENSTIDFQLSPNPFKDFINISLVKDLSKNAKMELYDFNGIMVKSKFLLHREETINLIDVPNGVYIMKVYNDGRMSSDKIVKE